MRNNSQLNYWMNDLKVKKQKAKNPTTYGGANQVIIIDQICDTELL